MKKGIKAILGVILVFSLASCGEEMKEMPQGEVQTGEGIDKVMPSGHPVVQNNALDEISKSGHPTMASTKEVKVSAETKKTWTTVKLEVTDLKTSETRAHTITIGKSVNIADGISLKAETFLPDYTIFDEYIGSKSEEPNNPALLIKLSKGDKVESSGWIFEKFTDFNSFTNDNYVVVLTLPAKK